MVAPIITIDHVFLEIEYHLLLEIQTTVPREAFALKSDLVKNCGPIIDENGNVVGVAVAKLDLEISIESFGVVAENVNFGIKLSNLKTILDDNNVNYTV